VVLGRFLQATVRSIVCPRICLLCWPSDRAVTGGMKQFCRAHVPPVHWHVGASAAHLVQPEHRHHAHAANSNNEHTEEPVDSARARWRLREKRPPRCGAANGDGEGDAIAAPVPHDGKGGAGGCEFEGARSGVFMVSVHGHCHVRGCLSPRHKEATGTLGGAVASAVQDVSDSSLVLQRCNHKCKSQQ
jgi:hypothetical protein